MKHGHYLDSEAMLKIRVDIAYPLVTLEQVAHQETISTEHVSITTVSVIISVSVCLDVASIIAWLCLCISNNTIHYTVCITFE